VAAKNGYDIEPTGSDAVNENGKVERTNGTFGAKVRFLLYIAVLSVKLWCTALVHAVYLKNRLFHKAPHKTPYEECTGVKPPLGHLHTCVALIALIATRKPDKRPAKAGRHMVHGVLLGFSVTPKYVRYFHTTTNRENLSIHHVIDEAHYGKS
jgi:hypothetical protein